MAVTPIDSLQNSSPETGKNQIRREDFIDEALVQKMVMSNAYQRPHRNHEEIAISSSEDDYAGWNLPTSTSFGRAA